MSWWLLLVVAIVAYGAGHIHGIKRCSRLAAKEIQSWKVKR